MEKTEIILKLAQSIANEHPDFFTIKGPGRGDLDTAQFMKELGRRAQDALGHDYSEQKICGDGLKLAVDFYIPDEATIIELALGLRNPTSEFEHDILKALLARQTGLDIQRLIFLSKPGALSRHGQPSSKAIAAWAQQNHEISIVFLELANPNIP